MAFAGEVAWITGASSGIGAAMAGLRPICEMMRLDFATPAFDQIVSQVAKHHARSKGNTPMPITIRLPFGGGIGAVEHHSESNEAYFAHTAGLRVISPSNPHDAFVMIRQAIACDDPVVYFEPKRRYWDKANVDETLDIINTGRPPKRSTSRPTCGPAKADTHSAKEKAAKMVAGDKPRSLLAGMAVTAGR